MNNEEIKENHSLEMDSATEEISDEKPIEEIAQLQEAANESLKEAVQAVIDTTDIPQKSHGNQKQTYLKSMKEKLSVVKEKAGSVKGKADIVKDKAGIVKDKAGALKSKSADVLKKAHINLQDKIVEKNEMKPDKVVLAPGEVKRYKLFFVSDMEEEAAYLHQMSLNGMHFVKKAGIQYVFRTGETKNYFYHLGYYEKDKRDGERYTSNYADAGWENIYHEKGEFDGVWNYFRTEIKDSSFEPHIFSDRISRIALYDRLLSSWRALLAMMVICLLCMGMFLFFLNFKTGRVGTVFLILSVLISIVILLIFAVYSRIYLKINKKLAELKK